MPNSDAFGYKKFGGGVRWFLGFFRAIRYEAAGLKKVPGYIKLGRSERCVPQRSFECGFREKIARSEKVARRSKIFRLNPAFEGRVVSIAHDPRFT
jgi:hypothetical protein